MGAPRGNKNAVGNRGGGRKSKYTAEAVRQAEELARMGATDEQIAAVLSISTATLDAWKKRHIEFSESLKSGKEVADARVSESLFRRAIGYSHPDEKIFQYEGQPVRVPTIKYYPPDTTAAIFWLKNRRPDLWRDKREVDSNVHVKLEDEIRKARERARRARERRESVEHR